MDWATVGVIAAVVGLPLAALATWATIRTIPPKRRLGIEMTSTRLFTRDKASGAADRLWISHATFGVLADPTVVRLSIRNTGRAAISSALYDRDTPIKLHLGVKILELLEASNALTTQVGPPAEILDEILLVGPGLIGQQEWLTYELLVDGDPHLTIEHALIDVEVVEIDPAQERLAVTIGRLTLKAVLNSALEVVTPGPLRFLR
ncbi:hypothetical protein [Kribbella sp. NPDC004536]|uniref:hypothetical protein n=1 Tax=Kribbella sp. NPDC004536 TaxID=3364106 RepID=UPI00369CCD1F